MTIKPEVNALPMVLAGPILRHCSTQRMVCWLAVSKPFAVRLSLSSDTPHQTIELTPGQEGLTILSASEHLHYLLIDVALEQALPQDCWIDYALELRATQTHDDGWTDITEINEHLCYPDRKSLGFVLPSRVHSVLHGSCRKPHHRLNGDGLVTADELLQQLLDHEGDNVAANEHANQSERPAWPSALIMSGDQIYVDDVAGPMLHAILQVIKRLALPNEELDCAESMGLNRAQALYSHSSCFYHREDLLPRRSENRKLIEVMFGGVEKPIFTTDSAHNHLITLGEVLSMYLLCWSPALWPQIDLTQPSDLDEKSRERYAVERQAIEAFVAGLPAVQRLLAHLPTAMIFDDHDITDDWNLSRHWEEMVYGHPFSKRVVGNALLAYLINQGWGNRPEAFSQTLMQQVQSILQHPGQALHDTVTDQLLHYDNWHYIWQTEPPLVVLDTRTHRWRSESSAAKPSGLLNWEKLTDLQQAIKGYPAILLVSGTPLFGVKLIEVIQRVFSYCGHPLMVDAENWMAHPGSAYGILNIFRHPQTPQNFVILSGDVHYSFVYDVELRRQNKGPDIWQICSSGLRNQFPPSLLSKLDRANRWLYSSRSPLNWLTRRRHMKITPRKPEGAPSGRRLLNGCGIGLVELDAKGTPWRIRQVLSDGPRVIFTRREDESRWD